MSTTINGDTGIIFPDASTQSKAVSQATPFAVTASAIAGAELQLPEATANGVNYVALKAADTLGANLTLTLPAADGTNGQVMQTNGSGALSFVNQPTPTSLASPLAVTGNATAGAEIRLPEDTDNGANYVALKSPDALAANLTLTLPAADGTNGQFVQTNGSGQLAFATVAPSGTQQFTSSGSITAGQAVSLNSDGTVSTTTGINQIATFNTATTYSSGSDYSFGSFYDSATGWHFAGLVISSYIYMLSYKVSSAGAITNQNSLGIFSFDATDYKRGVIFKDTTSGKIMFVMGGSNASTIYMQAITVNSSTGALTAAGFTSVGSNGYTNAPFDAYFDSFANRIVVVWYSGGGNTNVYAYSYNGSAFSLAATANISMLSDNSTATAAAFNSNTNTGRAFFRFGGFGYMGTCSISINSAGNTITLSSPVNCTSTQFYSYARAQYFPSIDRFLVQHASTGQTLSILFNASGTEITSTTTSPLSALYYSWQQYGFSNSYDTVNNVAYCASSDATGNTGVYTWSYALTASTITYTNGSSLSNAVLSRGTSYAYNPTLGRGGIAVRNYSSGSTFLVGVLPALFSTTADKFIGFSTQSVSTGAPVTVTTLGGINTNQSALTTGLAYYLQVTGALSTTPSTYGIVARALSATSVQVTTGGAFKKLISQTVISGSPGTITFTLPAGYSQFELAFQYVRGGTTSSPAIAGTLSGGSSVSFLGRGLTIFSSNTSPTNSTTSGSALGLTGGQTHASGSPFGGSLLLQSSSSISVWSYQVMTSFYNSGESYFSGTGYLYNDPTSVTLSGFGTFTDGGVITLYGIG
jgi:hypothetical protein